jgi:hypothetical protein
MIQRLKRQLALAGRVPDNWIREARRCFQRHGSAVSHAMTPDGDIGYIYIARRNGMPSVLRVMDRYGRQLAVFQGRQAETVFGGAPLDD